MIPFGAAAGGFAAVNRVHTSGSSAIETVPNGATKLRIRAYGGGATGAGSADSAVGGPGGGGGGFCEIAEIAVAGGQTLTYTVAAAQTAIPDQSSTNGAHGNASSVSGTVTGGAVSMTANGGVRGSGRNGSGGTPGTGGTASGGTTNTTGGTGGAGGVSGPLAANGPGGAAAGPGGGASGVAPGGGGSGWGFLTITNGARGQVEFYYT